MTQSESDEAVSEMVSTDSQIVDTVKDVVKRLNDDTYEVSEIETDHTQEYYLKLVGETIPGKVLVVNTTEDKNYEEYQQFVPVNDEVYYVVHDKFFKDQQSYQDYVDAIKDDRTYRLHKYTDDPCRVPLEEAYAGIMDGYMIQKENSSSDSISLVE